jgi:hypothetical protein
MTSGRTVAISTSHVPAELSILPPTERHTELLGNLLLWNPVQHVEFNDLLMCIRKLSNHLGHSVAHWSGPMLHTASVIQLMAHHHPDFFSGVIIFRRVGRPDRSELGRQIFAASVAITGRTNGYRGCGCGQNRSRLTRHLNESCRRYLVESPMLLGFSAVTPDDHCNSES